ncbi:MAG: hypothetical protein MZV65_34450 [Chromatiales bacterium]|nr:hypothetical protein [Chromatiales bacterium]
MIGVGGGGGNAVDHMVSASIEGVEFIVANTDAQALKKSACAHHAAARAPTSPRAWAPAPTRQIGRQAAVEDRERIAEVLAGRGHGVHHRRHGWRHRHRRGAGGGAGGQATSAS